MATDIGEGPATGLGKLLQDERFVIPTHQRDYSWAVDDVAALLDDIEGALGRDEKHYFIGLMVFMGSDGRELIVLDGQQRLATAVIYFSAVRNWLRQYGEFDEDGLSVQDWFIGRKGLGKREPQPRIVLNSANHQTFLDYVVARKPLEDLKLAVSKLKRYDRNKKLLDAAIYCHERIWSSAENKEPSDIAAHLFEIVDYVMDNVGVVCLKVSNEETAFTIFETLNDRGVELSPLDLVKNYLFSKAGRSSRQRLRDMEDRWVQMMAILSNVKADSYLKAFWTSRHGRAQATNLFKRFKAAHNDADSAINVSVDMLAAAEQYAALETSDDPIWSIYSAEAKETVRALKLLGAQQTHPVLLAALQRFEPPEVEKLLKMLESIIVRYQLIGGGRTGKLEIVCARLSEAIFIGKIKDGADERSVTTARDAFREAHEIYPSDQTFEDEFALARERNNQKAVYILRAIERERRRQELGSRAPENELGSLTLEHVLPKNPGQEWEKETKADPALREDCTYRLGNQTLLTKRDNKDIGRVGFDRKKALYAESDIFITRRIAKYDAWNRTSIEQRQRHMAKLAVSIWRFQ